MPIISGGGGGGGSQPFIAVSLRHSNDFTNLKGGTPIISGDQRGTVITLPPSLFTDDGTVSVTVETPTDADANVSGALVVQNAAGTVWLEQDVATPQFCPRGSVVTIAFTTNGGSAGAGLSWSVMNNRIDIASAGVYSAFVSLYAEPV